MTFLTYIRLYLNDPNSVIYTDAAINALAVDAEQQINQDCFPLIFQKFCLATTSGQSVYTLPSQVRSVSRITWRGRRLDPVSWEDFISLTPATAFISAGNPHNVETSIGRPLYYTLHPTNLYDLRFYPCPNETFGTSADPYSPDVGASCIVSCWRNVDSTLADPLAMLPTYVDRRMRKAYVLWKIYAIEGKGQNLGASKYYAQKYKMLCDWFNVINSNPFIAKRYQIEDGTNILEMFRYPRPILPSNFEFVRY